MPLTPHGMLRPGLLAGTAAAVREPWAATLVALGAEVAAPPADLAGEQELAAWADAAPAIDVVIGGAADDAPVEAALDPVWLRIRAVANAHWIGVDRDGAVLLVAPRPAACPDAEALRAALENLARTLSIEWARYGVRTTTVLPGDETTDDEIAALLAFLASPAAAYWSGCVVELGGAAARSQS